MRLLDYREMQYCADGVHNHGHLCLVMEFWGADDSQARPEGGLLVRWDGSAAPCCADKMPASAGSALSLACEAA